MSSAAPRFALSAVLIAATGCADAGGEWRGAAERPESRRSGLSVATFNAQNLFRADSPQYRERVQDVAGIIDRLESEVVVLQEIGTQAVLEDLAVATHSGFVHAILHEGNDPRGIDLGVLSAVPVALHRSHRHEVFPGPAGPDGPWFQYARDCVEVHVVVDGRRVIVLGVHFKSKRDDDPEWRLAEAQHTGELAAMLAEEFDGSGVILTGDFNDTPESVTMRTLVGDDYASATAGLPEAERWTVRSWPEGDGVALHDDVIAAAGLTTGLDSTSVRILHDAIGVSDHAPVRARYRLPEE